MTRSMSSILHHYPPHYWASGAIYGCVYIQSPPEARVAGRVAPVTVTESPGLQPDKVSVPERLERVIALLCDENIMLIYHLGE